VSPAPEARRGTREARESGSAVVDFVLVSALLVMLFLAIGQLSLALHVRNTLVAAASEGARYGADADRSPADGADRTRELIRQSLSGGFADDVSASMGEVDGVSVVVVEVRARLPLLGWLGPSRALVVRGHAFEEATS
jgi:Flp pilus assembly protein TadG